MNHLPPAADAPRTHEADAGLPSSPVQRWLQPVTRFLHVETISGAVLLAATIVALALANSPWSAEFAGFWQMRLRIGFGAAELDKPMLYWVNDGLMTWFFFVVGLEIKREWAYGELRDPRKAALPMMAAIGGMIVPAAIFLALRAGRDGASGWGVPMATDIAFAVGVLALMGKRVPLGLKITMLALAIVDDIGAVIVMAVFYSKNISAPALGLAALGFVAVALCNRIGIRQVAVYLGLGVVIWFACLKSGVHPTMAGVVLGLLTPAYAWFGDHASLDIAENILFRLRRGVSEISSAERARLLGDLQTAARESVSPLARLESMLHRWVAFVIVPIFALANAGVTVQLEALAHPVAVAVALGLVIGKPVGIVLFSWLAVRLRLARLPDNVSWPLLFAGGCVAGIGFTMSLFIADMALPLSLLDSGKIGTLAGSAVSAALGILLLWRFLPARPAIREGLDHAG